MNIIHKYNVIGLLFFLCFSCQAQRYCVILAGGSGERLWPLSDSVKPKQMLSVDGRSTLLEQAIERIEGIVPRENIWLCITPSIYESVKALVGERVGRILVEPDKRDTAPAILYSCLHIQEEDPEAQVLFTAADAYIPYSSYAVFRSYVEKFYIYNNCNVITLFGVRPTYAATGYGYIEYNTLTDQNGFFVVSKFHEKPSEDVAKEYLALGTVLWNMGMFGGSVSSFIKEYQRYAPDIFNALQAHICRGASYSDIRKVSIDYVVLEKSNCVVVLPVAFPWCDVGNIRVFLSLQNAFALDKSPVISHKSKNNLVKTEKGVIALLGVDNLCVVQRGDVILIANQDYTEEVKYIVEQCKKSPQFNVYV